mgnify:CR=1 FL=1
MEFEYTPDQVVAKDTIKDFVLKSKVEDEDYFITLSGFAGTGKTTITNDIIQEIKFKKKIVVSAPTHTAKEVIASVTKTNAETIQALLGLRPDLDLTDFNPNKPQFAVKADERISKYDVLIIDESSMLGKSVVKLIKEKAILNKVTVIFMGDKYQLPPIGEVISSVFTMPNQVELTTIVRQSGTNPNLKLIELARNDVRDKTDNCIPYLRSIVSALDKGEGFKLADRETYYTRLLDSYFDSEYQQNANLTKTICYTNKAVNSTNDYIRKRLIHSDEIVAVGDILMGYKTVSRDIKNFPFFESIVKNSVSYMVTGVEILERKVGGVILKGYKVLTKEGEYPMFVLHPDSYIDFTNEYADRLQTAMRYKRWKPFYDFKNEIQCMEDLNIYGGNKCSKDLGYGYAITVHKSQGSTYQHVAVTLKDILTNYDAQERRKLIYVALSRTSKTNLIYLD